MIPFILRENHNPLLSSGFLSCTAPRGLASITETDVVPYLFPGDYSFCTIMMSRRIPGIPWSRFAPTSLSIIIMEVALYCNLLMMPLSIITKEAALYCNLLVGSCNKERSDRIHEFDARRNSVIRIRDDEKQGGQQPCT